MATLGHVGANPAKMKMFHPAQKASEMKLSMEEGERKADVSSGCKVNIELQSFL